MRKVFTLVLAMTIVITSFAQVRSLRPTQLPKPAQMVQLTGFEERDMANFPASNRSIVESPEILELSYTTYDWQSNAAARNFTAVWPDGYAVMCYTIATEGGTNFTDRGTGLAIWDPAVGEWEYTETRVESVKTGFGSIARYKENGLVLAAHTANDCRLFIVEDFRDGGNRDFGEGIILPTTGEDGRTYDPCWPIIQCSGENLDIIHIMTTEYSLTEPYGSALLYTRYENGQFTVVHRILPNLDANNLSDGGSNITYFMPYDPAKPNRISFVLNNAWSDGKAVISEDNGENWTDRVFYQHPGINTTYGDEESFFYPRWTTAAFDANDNLHIAYEWNGSTGEPGSGSYYPNIGGVGYWSEVLPKNELCVGGIGNVGEPFVMDSSYLNTDLYYSEWYWSNAIHDPLPEYIGELQILDGDGEHVVPFDGEMPEEYLWVDLENKEHGKYNSGIAAFPSMYYDVPTNRIIVFWAMICGDGASMYYATDYNEYYYRVFCSISMDGGRTWGTPTHVIYDFMNAYKEMVYGQVIPYLYEDADGEYVWYLFQCDEEPGTFVQGDHTTSDETFYGAVKVYLHDMTVGIEENPVEVPTTMMVYPNPAQGSFTMELNQESDVNIFNAVGQLVKSYNNVRSLTVNDLEAGIYILKAGDQTQRVVVF